MAYGTREHRREPRHHQEARHESMGDDMMDMGKMAVGGMITVGVIGALGNAFHKD